MIKKTTVSFYKRAFPAGAFLVPTIAQIPSDSPEMVTFEMQIEAKEKRYVLPMPDGLEGESWRAMHIAIREKDEGWYGSAYHYDITASETPSYTQADIDAAPDWVKAITPVEVTDDEQ